MKRHKRIRPAPHCMNCDRVAVELTKVISTAFDHARYGTITRGLLCDKCLIALARNLKPDVNPDKRGA